MALFDLLDTNWLAFLVAGGVVSAGVALVLWAALTIAGRHM